MRALTADTIGCEQGKEVPVGVLQRFERRLEGMVEGAFARAFKSEVEPVEIASAVQREMDDRAAIVAQGRTGPTKEYPCSLACSRARVASSMPRLSA